MFENIPQVKLGIIAVSRDCFPLKLSESRRAAITKAYTGELYECKVTVENEKDMLKAVEDVKAAGCNALVVFLGNFEHFGCTQEELDNSRYPFFEMFAPSMQRVPQK